MGAVKGGGPLGSMRWRNTGPHRGGRVVAVAGHPQERMTFLFGSTGGGVWKTTNGGLTWQNISDGYLGTASVGAIAIAPSDPNVIYVGMGECSIRGNVSYGDGVYRSTDGGLTWQHLGLAATQHIARIRIHPKDPDVAYVAALGHAFGPNPERGVYRTKDGGRTWEQVLYRSENAGAIDLQMDPTNPRILYAAIWQARRGPWYMSSGGEESGLYKSVDGGDNWQELTGNPGLPEKPIGKIGVAVSGAQPQRVWAMVEAQEGGVYRSDDAGATWTRLNADRSLRSRAWYYTHTFADPQDPETFYVLNNFFWKSTDGGRSFFSMATPHADNHDLWIDPRDPLRMIHGADGGGCVSFDGGQSWSSIHNQPTCEFYHVETDTRFPYRIYGAQQDNTTLSVPSRSDNAGIGQREWYDVGGAESGYIAARPDDPNIIFAGSSGGGEGGRITRYDHRTRQRRDVSVWPEKTAGLPAQDYTYRFQWTSPIVLSPHDPDILYSAANRIFRSTDEGHSWECISPDLTRDDKEKQAPSGGPITKDHTGVEVYCTVFALAESPLQQGLLWAGSDDGLIHVSRDNGRTWQNVTPSQLPEWALISIIEPSHRAPGTAYVAATRYKLDDMRPYLLKTTDYGQSWQAISDGIPEDDYTRVIREDPEEPGLLYCGTETGVYVSLDDGGAWRPLQLNLPVVPVHDLKVAGDDLVAATHGRSFWVLDDVTPLRQLRRDPALSATRLFRPADTYRFAPDTLVQVPNGLRFEHPIPSRTRPAGDSFYLTAKPKDGEAPVFLDAGQNPPAGVVIHYYLSQADATDVTLTIRDAAGAEIRSFSSAAQDEKRRLTVREGANRFIWDMRYPHAALVDNDTTMPAPLCVPLAPPGSYQVELRVGDAVHSASFRLVKDPRVEATQSDLDEQFALLLRVRDKVSSVHRAIDRIRRIRGQLDAWCARIARDGGHDDIVQEAKGVGERLTAIEEELIQVRLESPQDSVNFPPKLNTKIAHIFNVAASADARPTDQTYKAFDALCDVADGLLGQVEAVAQEDLASLNEQLLALGTQPVATD